ncbi:MAG: site-2 protease family protein [Candidatus Bathyarchaeia archaeon]
MTTAQPNTTIQTEFEKLKEVVAAHFQIEDALIEHGVPTFYLKQPQETKQPFLQLLKMLEPMGLMAILRKIDGKIVLKILQKPLSKPSNVLVNWLLLFATIGTTFATGYILSVNLANIGGTINPIIGGIMFTAAIVGVLGTHEMGHKLTANKEGIEATPPYFIPGPPPTFGGIGTFGAIIIQRSLPSNKDALFDVGASGPIVGFIAATIVTAIGLTMSVPAQPVEGAVELPVPLMMIFIGRLLGSFRLIPQPSSGQTLYLHPVGFAGWVCMVVTMLNLLPAAMLDGGHIARATVGDKVRAILTATSIVLLVLSNFWLMALFVLFMSMQRHPGPLDDVSKLSTKRKLLAIVLIAIFVLTFPMF